MGVSASTRGTWPEGAACIQGGWRWMSPPVLLSLIAKREAHALGNFKPRHSLYEVMI